MAYHCPVCGYDKLTEKPYDTKGNPSYEICVCCGFQYGYDDVDQEHTFESYFEEWLNNGAKWFEPNSQPKDWDIKNQLQNIKRKHSGLSH